MGGGSAGKKLREGLGLDAELQEYLSKRIRIGGPTPLVTQAYFDIDCCVRFLKVPYEQFLRWPRIIKKAYQYYFMLRGYYEEQEQERMKQEQERERSKSPVIPFRR